MTAGRESIDLFRGLALSQLPQKQLHHLDVALLSRTVLALCHSNK